MYANKWKFLVKIMYYFGITRLKCKSSARVKIVLKKDLIVKKVFKSWKMLKKNVKKKIKMSEIFFGKNQKKSEKNNNNNNNQK